MENTPSGVSGQNAQQLVEEEPKHAIAPALIPHLRMAGNPVLIKDLVQRLRPKAVMSNLVQVSYTVVETYRTFSLKWHPAMRIYCNKGKRLHTKRVQLPQDWFLTSTWPP